jgi:hypothetical protein
MAQSLAPLKRKNNFHSLIFLKILEAKGLLNLDDIIFNPYKQDNTYLTFIKSSLPIVTPNLSEQNLLTKELMTKELNNKKTVEIKNPVLIENSENNSHINKITLSNLEDGDHKKDIKIFKNVLNTYFPRGRKISD